jgi:uncharacterized protein (DUF1800 family)
MAYVGVSCEVNRGLGERLMAPDENLFFARRLGLGLRAGETITGSVRDWAVDQISVIPALDFYGPAGVSLRDQLAEDADPLPDFPAACKVWEIYRVAVDHLDKVGGSMSSDDFNKLGEETVWRPYMDIPRWRDCLVKTLTAVNGPSPVFERFWWFWCNHFTVSTTEAEIKLFYGPHTRNIRKWMTGGFSDMLHDAILNPGMLVYLDNDLSTGPKSRSGQQNNGNLNENLAREMFELHTMSPAGGYSQQDVIEAALALTGWQFYAGVPTHGRKIKGAEYGTWFQSDRHEPGSRTILGKTYESKDEGRNQAPELLADLAARPETAKYLSWKLARHFVSDDPPADSVERIRQAWNESAGNLVAVHTAVIDEVMAHGREHQKFTRPENWLTEAYRTTGVPVPLTRPWPLPGTGEYWIDALFKELGQSYDQCPQPNGYSDLMSDWISKETLDRRIRLSYDFGQKIDGLAAESLKDYADRLAGADSEAALKVKRAGSKIEATTLLLSCPQFLKA